MQLLQTVRERKIDTEHWRSYVELHKNQYHFHRIVKSNSNRTLDSHVWRHSVMVVASMRKPQQRPQRMYGKNWFRGSLGWRGERRTNPVSPCAPRPGQCSGSATDWKVLGWDQDLPQYRPLYSVHYIFWNIQIRGYGNTLSYHLLYMYYIYSVHYTGIMYNTVYTTYTHALFSYYYYFVLRSSVEMVKCIVVTRHSTVYSTYGSCCRLPAPVFRWNMRQWDVPTQQHFPHTTEIFIC